MRPASLLLIALALGACDRDRDEERSVPDSRRAATDTAKVYLAVYTEPDAVAVMRSLGEAEMAAARVARDITLNDDVRRYVGVLLADHRGINELIEGALGQTGATARDNETSTQIRNAGDSIATALGKLPSGFNNTFIEEQIKSHEHALLLLDTAIVPSIRSEQVRTLLQQARPTLVAHLQRAKQILADRRRAAAERGEAWESGLHVTRPVAPRPVAETPAPPRPEPPRPARIDTPVLQPYTVPPRDTAPPPPVTTTFE